MGFLQNLQVARTERYILEGGNLDGFRLPGLLLVLNSFTPQGLELFIAKDQSLLSLYRSALPPLQVTKAAEKMQRWRAPILDALAGVSWERVLTIVRQRLPEHGVVLQAHKIWYSSQAQALGTFLQEALSGKPEY